MFTHTKTKIPTREEILEGLIDDYRKQTKGIREYHVDNASGIPSVYKDRSKAIAHAVSNINAIDTTDYYLSDVDEVWVTEIGEYRIEHRKTIWWGDDYLDDKSYDVEGT